MKTNLYILLYPHSIKIGKADCVIDRIKQIRRHWGIPDLNKSYLIEGTVESIGNLELALHRLLDEFNMGFSDGDGKTEFFETKCLEFAIEYIFTYLKASNKPRDLLKQGLPNHNFQNNQKKKKTTSSILNNPKSTYKIPPITIRMSEVDKMKMTEWLDDINKLTSYQVKPSNLCKALLKIQESEHILDNRTAFELGEIQGSSYKISPLSIRMNPEEKEMIDRLLVVISDGKKINASTLIRALLRSKSYISNNKVISML